MEARYAMGEKSAVPLFQRAAAVMGADGAPDGSSVGIAGRGSDLPPVTTRAKAVSVRAGRTCASTPVRSASSSLGGGGAKMKVGRAGSIAVR